MVVSGLCYLTINKKHLYFVLSCYFCVVLILEGKDCIGSLIGHDEFSTSFFSCIETLQHLLSDKTIQHLLLDRYMYTKKINPSKSALK